MSGDPKETMARALAAGERLRKRGRAQSPREASTVARAIKLLCAMPRTQARKHPAAGRAGEPDIYGSSDGMAFFFEVKRIGGRGATELQAARLLEWSATGAATGVITRPEEAVLIISRALKNRAGGRLHPGTDAVSSNQG